MDFPILPDHAHFVCPPIRVLASIGVQRNLRFRPKVGLHRNCPLVQLQCHEFAGFRAAPEVEEPVGRVRTELDGQHGRGGFHHGQTDLGEAVTVNI